MNMIQRLKERLVPSKQDAASPPAQTAPTQDAVSHELSEQKELFTAYYVHQMSQGQAQVRDKDLDPNLLAKAQQAAEVHMDYLYPTTSQIARDRHELGELDDNLDHALRDYGNDKRLLEMEASQEAYSQASERASSQKTAAQVDPSYAALMRETGQMQKRIQDETGMTMTYNENDIRQLHDFEDQCKERIHQAVEKTNPSVGDVMMEATLRGKMAGSIEAARQRNAEMDKEYAKDLGKEIEDVHMGEALSARASVKALEDAEKGDRDALDRDEVHMGRELT